MPRWRIGTGGADASAGLISTNRMSEPKEQFLEQTRRFWQKRTDRPLSLEDSRQIVENVTGLFEVLAQWAEAESRTHPQPTEEAVNA